MALARNAGLLAALLGASMLGQGFSLADTTSPAATDVSAAADESGLLDDDTLDAMTSPIALYPDALLGQVLVATTYPVDVLKADRFLTAHAAMTDKERAAAVGEQDWDDSVKSLAAGFPQLVGRMAEHIDWTELMGDALIAQADDVLVSIQRLRAQAQANGYLEDNAAMTVMTDPSSENISIAATDPNAVYVPEYTNVVYTQPAPTTAYYVSDGNDWGNDLATGAIIWGTVLIVDDIFDNDWDHGYWHGDHHGGGNSIDWNGDINIDGGINIGSGNIGSGNHPNLGSGSGNLGGIGNGNRPGNGIGGGIGGDNGLGGGQLGALDQDKMDRLRDGNFNPSPADRDAAREKIAGKAASGKGVMPMPPAKGAGDRGAASAAAATKLGTKPSAGYAPSKAAAAKAKAPNVSKPSKPSKPPSARKPSAKAPVYKPQGGSKAKASSSRGKSSRGGR